MIAEAAGIDTSGLISLAKMCSLPSKRCFKLLGSPIAHTTMRLLSSLLPSLLVAAAGVVQAASSWSFDEAIISVASKGAEAQFKDK